MLDLQALYRSAAVQRILVARRRNRARSFLSRVKLPLQGRVLDVGCGIDGNSFEAVIPATCEIVGIDLHDPTQVGIHKTNFKYIQRDAVDLSIFPDGYFDLAVSVGMMEHICDREKLRNIAHEMMRASNQSVLVVPWRYAWLEPHFKLPFFQLLPWSTQLALIRIFNCNGYRQWAVRNPEELRAHIAKTYQWLPTAEWKAIFSADTAYLSPTLETLIVVRKS